MANHTGVVVHNHNIVFGRLFAHQGGSGDITTGGTTILTAIKNTVSKDTQVIFSKDGTGAAGQYLADVLFGDYKSTGKVVL